MNLLNAALISCLCSPALAMDLEQKYPKRLIEALATDDWLMVKQLLIVNFDAKKKILSLFYAIAKGHEKEVSKLIDKGVILKQAKLKYGITPIHMAVFARNLSMVEFLIKQGLSATILDSFGKKPSDYAESKDERRLMVFLKEQEEGPKGLDHNSNEAQFDSTTSKDKIIRKEYARSDEGSIFFDELDNPPSDH